MLMLGNPTEDSVEVTVAFLKECGARLKDVSPRGLNCLLIILVIICYLSL